MRSQLVQLNYPRFWTFLPHLFFFPLFFPLPLDWEYFSSSRFSPLPQPRQLASKGRAFSSIKEKKTDHGSGSSGSFPGNFIILSCSGLLKVILLNTFWSKKMWFRCFMSGNEALATQLVEMLFFVCGGKLTNSKKHLCQRHRDVCHRVLDQ